jgi:hypothetical protein
LIWERRLRRKISRIEGALAVYVLQKPSEDFVTEGNILLQNIHLSSATVTGSPQMFFTLIIIIIIIIIINVQNVCHEKQH